MDKIPLGLIVNGFGTEPLVLTSSIFKAFHSDYIGEYMPLLEPFTEGFNILEVHYFGVRKRWLQNVDKHYSTPFSDYAEGSFRIPIVFLNVDGQFQTIDLSHNNDAIITSGIVGDIFMEGRTDYLQRKNKQSSSMDISDVQEIPIIIPTMEDDDDRINKAYPSRDDDEEMIGGGDLNKWMEAMENGAELPIKLDMDISVEDSKRGKSWFENRWGQIHGLVPSNCFYVGEFPENVIPYDNNGKPWPAYAMVELPFKPGDYETNKKTGNAIIYITDGRRKGSEWQVQNVIVKPSQGITFSEDGKWFLCLFF